MRSVVAVVNEGQRFRAVRQSGFKQEHRILIVKATGRPTEFLASTAQSAKTLAIAVSVDAMNRHYHLNRRQSAAGAGPIASLAYVPLLAEAVLTVWSTR